MFTVAVLAGGLGTRVHKLTGGTTPKAMIPVAGRPFIDHKLVGLARQGAKKVVLLVGHAADSLQQHVGDGSNYGLQIEFIRDGPQLLGTGGAIKAALPYLGDSFWVTYADTYLRFDVLEAEKRFVDSGRPGLMVVLKNEDRWDVSNARIDDGLVVEYVKSPPPGRFQYIDYGMSLFARTAFDECPAEQAFDLGSVIRGIIDGPGLAAYEAIERFYEIGTPEGFSETEAFFRSIA